MEKDNNASNVFVSWLADVPALVIVLIILVAFGTIFVPRWLAPEIGLLPSSLLSSSTPISSSTSTSSASGAIFPIIIYHPDATGSSVINPSKASSSLSSLSRVSFTELFSGTGWSDASYTTAYEDLTATAISLAPDFSVQQVADAQPSASGDQLPGNLTGQVQKIGDKSYVASIPAYPNLSVTSSYPGVLSFGYDPQTRHVLVIYAAYMSRVFEIDANGVATDYSDRFGQRTFGGNSDGDLAVHPVIFLQDGAWWVSDGAGSTEPKLMKIASSAVIDYTDAFPGEHFLSAKPGPAAHVVHVTGDVHDYLLTDRGFKPTAVDWVSTRLNYWDGMVFDAMIDRADASVGDGIRYFISNDGGSTWSPAWPNQKIQFATQGGDLRFKIELSPQGDPYGTPWVGNFGISYDIQRKL
jgi:hypothetical protein